MSSSSSTLTFRTATPPDALPLASLINSAFRAEKTGQTWLYDEQDKRVDIVTTELIEGFIKGSDTVMLVGEAPEGPTQAGGIVATCYLAQPPSTTASTAPNDRAESVQPQHRTPGAAWLGFLAVKPDIHGRGLGEKMLREAERFVVKEWGVGRLEFDFVNSRNQLKAWYEKRGYRATGKVRPFHYGEGGQEILAPGLEMVVLGRDLE